MTEYFIQVCQMMINKSLASFKCDRTYPSVIYGVNSNGTYKVNRDGILIDVPNALGTTLTVGTLVWLKDPLNNKKQTHICGIRI